MCLRHLRDGYATHSEAMVLQGWVLFLLTSRMLLAKPRHTGATGRRELLERVRLFNAGAWPALLAEARAIAAELPRREGRTMDTADEEQACLQRACSEVKRGCPSRARQVLTAAQVAPGNEETWRELTNPVR